MKLQESLLSVIHNAPLSAGVTTFLHDDSSGHKTPLGGISSDGRLGWLALGTRLCVVDLKTGQKVAAWTFGALLSLNASITCVCELPSPLCDSTQQLIVSLAYEDIGGVVAVFHCNGSQVLRVIQTKAVMTELSVVEQTDGPLACCDSVVVAGTDLGELLAFDLNRSALIQALKNTSQGDEHVVRNEQNMTNLAFLSLDDIASVEEQRDIAMESDQHLAVNLNDQSYFDGEYVLRNPDGTVRMKAKRGHVTVTKLLYVPQLGSVIVGYNFGGFQIWNLVRMCLEYTSAVNVECLPVTHFGFQEPCDDPRAFCYLWVVYSSHERTQDEACPLAVMYSLTYQGKRIPEPTKCLYQGFSSCNTRFELDLTSMDEGAAGQATGGRSVSCHTYSVPSSLHGDMDEAIINLCQLVWESWSDTPNSHIQYTMLLFDLDQWYKGQMPEGWRVQNNTFMAVMSLDPTCTPLDSRLLVPTIAPYSHVQRLEEHFYPNSLQFSAVCLSPEQASHLCTAGVQRQLILSMDEMGPTVLLHPTPLYRQCTAAGLAPLYGEIYLNDPDVTEQRTYLLSVALEARLSSFLKKCARDWAMGSHSGVGCTLQLLVNWCWARALVLKQNARELTNPLLEQSGRIPDRNVSRCLEHCVRQLTLIVSLLDSVVTKCCNLIVPDALNDMEERCAAIGTVTLYFRVVRWMLSAGVLPSCSQRDPLGSDRRLPYPGEPLMRALCKRRMKLCCLDGTAASEEAVADKSCALLYIDQLIERECGGDLVHNLWRSEDNPGGLYPPQSLDALLRVYLLPNIADEHKHSLVLYLLLDYSATFVDPQYEAIIRRLMQFPTMFGLSNTAIKATQAFWHLDHRNFDFALDQLQCLTGNTLSDWQHSVLLSALLAQKKTQAALQYLHVRRAPRGDRRKDKLQDWQSCCELYLARGLLCEAMDVVRLSVQTASSFAEQAEMLNFFFDGCKRTGQLAKILQQTLLPLEEEMFAKYLQSSEDKQCADILVMYYMQQSRYLEAQRYNTRLRQPSQQTELLYSSMESCVELGLDRNRVRDMLVELACTGLPRITDKVQAGMHELLATPRVVSAKPMSVFVQAKSPSNDYVYKSSFIQKSIENASETWSRQPRLARGLKRALNFEDTPFICTPKLSKSRSIYDQTPDTSDTTDGATPSKRARLETNTQNTPQTPLSINRSTHLGKDVLTMLDIPEVESTPDWAIHTREHIERSAREGTPHSILKVRRTMERDLQQSPVDSRYLADTDDEVETGSRHSTYTHTSDKHLRFAIPCSGSSSSESSPSEVPASEDNLPQNSPLVTDQTDGTIQNISQDSENVSATPLQTVVGGQRRPYKDNVRARLSYSISANSSLNDDRNSSIESIADIPVMVINPRYSGESFTSNSRVSRPHPEPTPEGDHITINDTTVAHDVSEEKEESLISVRSDFTSTPRTPRSRPSIRSAGAFASLSTTRNTRSHSKTPETDVPSSFLVVSSPRPQRFRSRSKTPESRGKTPKGSPNLESIPEQPKLECIEDIPSCKILRTPEKVVSETETSITVENKVTVITEIKDLDGYSPRSECPPAGDSPLRRSQRSRSRTPEVESPKKDTASVKTHRGRSKTPEREAAISPKLVGISKSAKKKPLSRLVLEANVFTKISKSKSEQAAREEISPSGSDNNSKLESPGFENLSVLQDTSYSTIECTPMKDTSSARPIGDYEFSPIVDVSILSDSKMSILSNTPQSDVSVADQISPKTETPFSGTFYNKSVLGGYKSSSDQSENNSPTELDVEKSQIKGRLLEYSISPINNLSKESVLWDASSTPALSTENSTLTDDFDEPSTSKNEKEDEEATNDVKQMNEIQEEKQKIVDIVREINEIEDQIDSSDESDIYDRSSQHNSSQYDSNDNESDTADSGNDSETELSENSAYAPSFSNDISNGEDNQVICAGESEVISLDSEEEQGSPFKRARTTSQESNSMILHIDIDTNDEIELAEPSSRETENELEKNIESYLDASLSETIKDNVTVDNKIPFIKLEDQIHSVDPLKIHDVVNQQDNSDSVIDVFNACNYSLMTDDNSVLELDRSELNVTVPEKDRYEANECEVQEIEELEPMDETAKNYRYGADEIKASEIQQLETMDITKMDVITEKHITGADESKIEKTELGEAMDIKDGREIQECAKEEDAKNVTSSSADETDNKKREIRSRACSNSSSSPKDSGKAEIKSVELKKSASKPAARKRTSSNTSISCYKSEQAVSKCEETKQTTSTSASVSKRRASAKSNTSEGVSVSEIATPQYPSKAKRNSELEENTTEEAKQSEAKIFKRRASTKSQSSNKCDDDALPKSENFKITYEPEVQTAKVSKRRLSAKSTEETSKIATATLQDNSQTPLRRSTRRGSKQSEGDNSSLKSAESTQSIGSKVENASVKAAAIRKSRKSITVSSKPELSVIPEVDDSGTSRVDDNSQLVQDYSSTRRLTRNQRSLLERSMEPPRTVRTLRRASNTSIASIASIASEASLGDESTRSDPFGVQPIDPITLLNKKDFEGPADEEELNLAAKEFGESLDIVKSKILRGRRAASVSETGTIKELRLSRRLSTDLECVSSPVASLDGSMTGSPGRPRRTSFNKALEALATSKRGRRSSADVKEGETDSTVGSPETLRSKDGDNPVTPLRRTRRNSSVASDATPTGRSPKSRTRRAATVESTEGAQPKATKKK